MWSKKFTQHHQATKWQGWDLIPAVHHSPSVLIRVLGTYSGPFGFLVYVMSRDSDGVTSGTKAGGSIGNSWIPFLLVSRMSAWKGV